MGSKPLDADYVSTKEAAEILGISKAVLHFWKSKGKIKGSRPGIGRKLQFKVSDLLELKEVKKILARPEAVARLAFEASVRACRAEQRVDALHTALGIETDELSLNEDDVISFYLEADDIAQGMPISIDTIKLLEWAKKFLAIHAEYLRLVSTVTGDLKPSVVFITASEKISIQAQQIPHAQYDPVFRTALQSLGFARRSLYRVAHPHSKTVRDTFSTTKTMKGVEDHLMPLLYLP